DRVLTEVHARDRRRAHVARLAEAVVNAVGLRVLRPALAQLEPALELDVDRLREPLDLLTVEVPRQRIRREAGVVEDLVGPGAPDPGDHPLVAEERVQPARLARADRLERVGADAERLGAEVRELLLE